MNTPMVSIIMASFNNSFYISEAIESVISQSFNNWELIIVDDYSSDKSRTFIENFAAIDSRIKYIFNDSNIGPGESRNKAIKVAIGKWIAFLDADDIWLPTKIEKQLEFANKSNAYFTHSSYGYIDYHGNILKKLFIVSNKRIYYRNLLKRTEISCLTAMYNQEILGKFYMTHHRRRQDYALWLSILKCGFYSQPQKDVLAYYRQNPNSSGKKKWKLIFSHYKFLRENENLNIFESLFYTSHWAFNGFIRYYLK